MIITPLGSVLAAAYYGTVKLSRLELKVDTIWDFLIRRASAEVVQKGLGGFNSPLIINDEARDWFNGLAEDLKKFYANQGRHLSKRELYFEIERRFGDRLLKEICIPRGLNLGACLIIAQEIAQDVPSASL